MLADVISIVILIGTNNLGSGMTPSATARGVIKVSEVVKERAPRSEVYVVELLPRAKLQKQVAQVNAMIGSGVGSRIKVLKCGSELVENAWDEEEEWRVDVGMMPDGLHPSGEGVKVWMKCLKRSGVG